MLVTNLHGLINLPCSRIAFFAGSFDPIHDGHVAVAEAALRKFVDMVVFCAHSQNRKKTLTSIQERLEIIQKLLLSSTFHSRMQLIDPKFCNGIENDRFIEIAEYLVKSGRKVFILKGQDSLTNRRDYPLQMFDHIIHNRGGKEICLNNVIEGHIFRFGSVSEMSSTEAKRKLAKGEKVHSCAEIHSLIVKKELYARQIKD